VQKAFVPDLVEGFFDVDEDSAQVLVAVERFEHILCDAKDLVLCLLVVSEAALILGEELLGGDPVS
jgi:hypothetical protein